jgi:quercetin dioxygenase-like cupin family protein
MSKKNLVYLAAAAAAATVLSGGMALATTGTNLVGTVLARAAFGEPVDFKLKVGDEPPHVIHIPEAADTVMQRIVFAPGGQSGWHSHPGPAIVLVTRGELTLYDGDDPSCVGETFGVGQAFVDSGQGHVHLARNQTSGETEVWVTYLDVPVGGAFREDVADPGSCPPF